MKTYSKLLIFITLIVAFFGCKNASTLEDTHFPFEASDQHPYGQPNPEAPPEIKDFSLLIGTCDCESTQRIDKDHWSDTTAMIWRFKYIMNGMAIQDETLKEDGKHSGSIRQYIADSSKWYVHYYSSAKPLPSLPTWEGGKVENGNIVLLKDTKAPNGIDGDYRIIFSNISENGFDWHGEWVSKDGSYVYPTWKITCDKRHSK